MLIGITGLSCSGKSTLANKLQDKTSNSKIIHQDDYYNPVITIKDDNWDCPEAFDMEKMLHDIKIAIQTNHAVIVEGIMLVSNQDLVNLMDFVVFLNTDPQLCKERRKNKSYIVQNQVWKEPTDYFDSIVYPNFFKYTLAWFRKNLNIRRPITKEFQNEENPYLFILAPLIGTSNCTLNPAGNEELQ